MTTDPLPTHDTRVVPPPLGGIHLIEHIEGDVFMMGLDGMERLLSQSVCTRTQILVDIPMDSRFPGYSSWPQIRFPNNSQSHQCIYSMCPL